MTLPRQITAQPLTKEAFALYGDVIEVPKEANGDAANQGTAKRYNHLTHFTNLRSPLPLTPPSAPSTTPIPSSLLSPPALPNLCIFKSVPTPVLPFPIKLLERHKYSTQMFLPMNGDVKAYLVIVALNKDDGSGKEGPEWSTLKAFICDARQGFNYHVGVWHHPMIALEVETDFVCLVWERRENMTDPTEDCEEVHLKEDEYISVVVDGYRGSRDLASAASSNSSNGRSNGKHSHKEASEDKEEEETRTSKRRSTRK
ncbi:ureidoglycolate lyase [Synchytrium microbalum]|uniref:Ureidoglycolate lyase n=1 Tax=Synchytrium microbalum TaxID=1806994 RepID=A0A507BY56_9FUNG|nr:ureidoglycolate lyase [Synchytrium microbalum]TPX30203.1 ureidoglycolate lyase [Synchytrium microbalum]